MALTAKMERNGHFSNVPGLNQAKVWSQVPNLGLPYGWQKPNHISRHQLPPRVLLIRKLESVVEPGLHVLATRPDAQPCNWFVKWHWLRKTELLVSQQPCLVWCSVSPDHIDPERVMLALFSNPEPAQAWKVTFFYCLSNSKHFLEQILVSQA